MKKSHKEVLDNIFKHKEALEKAMGLPYVWVRAKELPVINKTGERADLVFQDMFDAYKGLPEATCYILELKKERGDHELLGQIKKYMMAMEKKARYGHWGTVKGLAVAPEFSESCLKLLWKAKIRTFLYSEDQKGTPVLTEKKIQRKAILTEDHLRDLDEYTFQ
jgi:hypothetical protein